MDRQENSRDINSVNFVSQEYDLLRAPADSLWTVEDVAIYLKLQPETIRSMARRGELPAIKIGKVWRFQKNAIHHMFIGLE